MTPVERAIAGGWYCSACLSAVQPVYTVDERSVLCIGCGELLQAADFLEERRLEAERAERAGYSPPPLLRMLARRHDEADWLIWLPPAQRRWYLTEPRATFLRTELLMWVPEPLWQSLLDDTWGEADAA